MQDFVTFKPPDSDYDSYDEENRRREQALGIPEKQRKLDPMDSHNQFVQKSLEAHQKMSNLETVMENMLEKDGENELRLDDENPRGHTRSFFTRAMEKLRKAQGGT